MSGLYENYTMHWKNDILPPTQLGLCEKHRSTTALLHYIADIIREAHNNNCINLILFDLSKAFDTFNSSKVEILCFRWQLTILFRNYLSNRKERVRIDNKLSM